MIKWMKCGIAITVLFWDTLGTNSKSLQDFLSVMPTKWPLAGNCYWHLTQVEFQIPLVFIKPAKPIAFCRQLITQNRNAHINWQARENASLFAGTIFLLASLLILLMLSNRLFNVLDVVWHQDNYLIWEEAISSLPAQSPHWWDCANGLWMPWKCFSVACCSSSLHLCLPSQGLEWSNQRKPDAFGLGRWVWALFVSLVKISKEKFFFFSLCVWHLFFFPKEHENHFALSQNAGAFW